MSRSILAMLTLALSLTSGYRANAQEFDGMVSGDAPSAPRASGLRFESTYQQFRTGNYEGGGPGPAGPCNSCGNGCNTCGGGLYCTDWKLVGWYASWDGHHGRGHGNGYGARTVRHCWSGFGY